MKRQSKSRVWPLFAFAPILIGSMIAFAGCGSKKETNQLESGNDSGEDMSIVQNDEEAQPKPSGNDPVEELKQLTLLARKLESEERFIEAVNSWTEIVSKLEQQYGVESWQSKNAVLAKQTAEQQANFDPQQKAILTRLGKLQTEIRAANDSGQIESAVLRAEEVVQKTGELFGANSAVAAKQRRLYGQLLLRQGAVDKAITQYTKSAVDLASYFGVAHPEVCNLHDELGRIYLETNAKDKAVGHLSSAAKLSLEIWGESSSQYAKRANQLGVGFYRIGNLRDALPTLLASEVIRRNANGPQSLEVAHSKHNIGTVLIEMGNMEGAIENLKAAREIFGKSELTALEVQVGSKLATAYMLSRQFQLAKDLLASEVQYLESNRGSGTRETEIRLADAKYRYSIALGRLQEYSTAIPVIQEARELNEKWLSVDHTRTVNCYQALSKMYAANNQPELARQVLSQLRIAQQSADTRSFR